MSHERRVSIPERAVGACSYLASEASLVIGQFRPRWGMVRVMPVDIHENLAAFLRRRAPDARYASFDYCFNYFQQARDAAETGQLADDERLTLSCLHLGFYLASWGMLRGSGVLYRRSVRALAPVVRAIASESATSWELDVPYFAGTDIGEVLALAQRIKAAYPVTASPILVSKTMLGVFGCVPAFDRFFRVGFCGAAFNRPTLSRINDFYAAHEQELAAVSIPTIDFMTGQDTTRRYPQAKIIDMIFFEEGYKRVGRERR